MRSPYSYIYIYIDIVILTKREPSLNLQEPTRTLSKHLRTPVRPKPLFPSPAQVDEPSTPAPDWCRSGEHPKDQRMRHLHVSHDIYIYIYTCIHSLIYYISYAVDARTQEPIILVGVCVCAENFLNLRTEKNNAQLTPTAEKIVTTPMKTNKYVPPNSE